MNTLETTPLEEVFFPPELGSMSGVITPNDDGHIPGVTVEGIDVIREHGFGKLGYGFAITDPSGRVFTYEHKPKTINGVKAGEVGIPSETVKGRFADDGLVEVEGFEHCLVRCLADEQGIDLTKAEPQAKLLLTRMQPFAVIDWVMSHDGDTTIGNTFGYVATMQANQPMAEYIALHARESHEATGGFFTPTDSIEAILNGSDDKGRPYRPSFDRWYATHKSLDEEDVPSNHTRVRLPNTLTNTGTDSNWRGLRF